LDNNGDLVIVNSTFTDNSSGDRGGAINVNGTTHSLDVTGSTFNGNDAGDGGAIFFSGVLADSLVVSESTFTGNTASGKTYSHGGAIRITGGTPVISNTTFTGNSATYAGGGLSVSTFNMRIYGSVFAGNSSTAADQALGGGLYNSNTTLLIQDSVVRDNWVAGTGALGGGIFSDGATTLDRVTISGNLSQDYTSGGIHSQDLLTMTNVTVSGNEAGAWGGAMTQTGAGAHANINNCTVVNNGVTSGVGNGGIHIYTTVYITNSIVAFNDNSNCVIGGTIHSGGYNIEDGNWCILLSTGDITGTDPLLLPEAYYGGPSVGAAASREQMLTYAPSSVSPAIDAGDNATCATVDQRGVSRPIDGDGDSTAICDMGAFEFNLVNANFLPLTLRNY
jgi:predicted outer membrane repeat protein